MMHHDLVIPEENGVQDWANPIFVFPSTADIAASMENGLLDYWMFFCENTKRPFPKTMTFKLSTGEIFVALHLSKATKSADKAEGGGKYR